VDAALAGVSIPEGVGFKRDRYLRSVANVHTPTGLKATDWTAKPCVAFAAGGSQRQSAGAIGGCKGDLSAPCCPERPSPAVWRRRSVLLPAFIALGYSRDLARPRCLLLS
jgi:hypothetical protein